MITTALDSGLWFVLLDVVGGLIFGCRFVLRPSAVRRKHIHPGFRVDVRDER